EALRALGDGDGLAEGHAQQLGEVLGALPGVGDRVLTGRALENARVGDREVHAADVVRSRDHGRVDDRAHQLWVAHGDVVVVPDVVALRGGVALRVVLLLPPHREARRADVAGLYAGRDDRLADRLHPLVGLREPLRHVRVVEAHA